MSDATPASFEPWPELGETQGVILLELLLRGPRSRARLAEAAGLSRTSLTRIARELIDAGLLGEGEIQASGHRGRPSESLFLRPERAHFVGVKLTGEAAYVVVTDLTAQVVRKASAPLPNRSVDAVVALVARLVGDVTADSQLAVAIGVGVAGDVSNVGGVEVLHRSNFLGWDGIALSRLISEATGLPTSMSNDVHALAASLHWFGGLGTHRSLVVYGLGAGIGSGLVVANDTAPGAHGRAGRIGHSRMAGRGVTCAKGHQDCIHSFVTMPAIEVNAGVGPGEYPVALERAARGDEQAMAAFRSAAFALGVAVADSVNTVDPEIVAIMGEGCHMLDLAHDEFVSGATEYLEQVDFSQVRIERPTFHFDNYAQGAAVVAIRGLLTRT
ncbi:ROK family protein [Pseudoclavibacter helvolus]|uniref:ROK family protein n=1 Tax=Pseudoclavibacter helvolus TaxID=255205 RepID=UPI003C7574CE